MNLRRGTSLIELMVVVTGCAAFLSLSGQLLHRAMRTQSESRRCFDAERTAWRLAKDFRRDANAALAATTAADDVGAGGLLRLELPGERIVAYRRDGASIVRTEKQGDDAASRETYSLPTATAIAVEFNESTRLATLSIGSDPEDEAAPPPTRLRDARIDVEAVAAVGRDRRFSAANASEEATP